ncbi:MAG TPA: CBS domain-containing protein [Rhodospirillaceae bacterium]|nr:CBS domain-containing protein [Rhodospirillaceae bacterium]
MRTRLVRDVIEGQKILCLAPTVTVSEAARRMKEQKVGSAMVVADGRLAGIFTERDALMRVLAAGLDAGATPLSAVMTAELVTIDQQATLMEALRLMHDGGFRHVPVVDAGRPVGIVSIRDALGEELIRFNREVAERQELAERLG